MFRRCQRESLLKRYFQERLSIPSHKQGKGYTMKLKYILFVCSIISFTIIKQTPIPRIGLEYMWTLPLIFGICIIKWGEIFSRKHGIGLYIFLFIETIRYLVQPILICLSNGELNHRMPKALPESYQTAIIIYIIECITSFTVIYYFYPRPIKLKRSLPKINIKYHINTGGWIIVSIFLLILIGRINVWIPELKILGIKEGIDKGLVLDASFFNVIKCFFFIFFLTKAYKTRNPVYISIAIMLGLFNILSYFGKNRSFIVETAITTIYLFILTFPRYKKVILTSFTPVALLIIGFTFITKQFGVENISEYNVSVSSKDIILEYSNIIEEYVNGLWTVARSYQASLNLPWELSLSSFVKDIMDGISGLKDLPFLKTNLFPLTDSLLSSSDIFKLSLKTHFEYAQMLSFSGGMFIIGGTLFGWPLMIISNFLMIRLLVYVDSHSIMYGNLYNKYIYIWMSCLMGLIHCYCMQTIIFCWSKFILFFWIILFINYLYAIKQYYYSQI